MTEKETTMPLWRTAEIVLGNAIRKHWNPSFYREGLSVGFAVLENEFETLMTAPEEDRETLNNLFAETKKKMFSEVGFQLEPFFYMPSSQQTLDTMIDQLLNKIRVYEEENGYDVKEMFLQAVLYDEWKMPVAENIRFELSFEEGEIFKLEELLKESDIPFYFNYREENRPTPFGAVPVELKNEELCITVGPVMEHGSNAIVVFPWEKGDSLLQVNNLIGAKIVEEEFVDAECVSGVSAGAAHEYIDKVFLAHRAEWWPAVYGGKAE